MNFSRHSKVLTITIIISLFYLLVWFSCDPVQQENDSVEGIEEDVMTSIPADWWKMPEDVSPSADPTHDDWIDLGWKTFIAMNWPAATGDKAIPGEPDTTKHISDANGDEVAWQGYLNVEQVFQPSGADPGTWTDPTVPFPKKLDPETGDSIIILGGLSKFSGQGKISDEFDEAASNSPLIDQNGNYVYYNIRINQSEFTYITQNGYYNATRQITDVDNGKFAGFPKTGQPSDFSPAVNLGDWARQGALELKMSWKILKDGVDKPERYFTMRAYAATPNNQVDGPFTFGLVGMHILRLTPTTGPTWYWATFEQIDNLTASEGITPSFNPADSVYTKGYSYKPDEIKEGEPLPADPMPVNVSRVTPIPSDVISKNSAYQDMLKGTVWQYYQMINTLNPDPDGPIKVKFSNAPYNAAEMVNATMETYTQVNTNCISCHQFGFPQGNIPDVDSIKANLQIFTFLLGRAEKQ